MTDIVPHAGSEGVRSPMLDLFRVPPTDLSVSSYRMVPVQTFTTGINPVEFQIDPQEDYIDLSRSYFEVELTQKKKNGDDLDKDEDLYPANNLAHTLFKQISVRLNGTLISPQTDTYHYKSYLQTLLNFDRVDGETVLKPQGWFNGIDFPGTFTANRLDTASNAGAGHNDFQALTATQQESIKLMKSEVTKYAGGNAHVLRFTPYIEVFYLNKLLIPGVQIGVQMYFNTPDLYLNGVGLNGRLNVEDVKIRLYLCQLRINPSVYKDLMMSMDRGRVVSYPTVRSEIRTFSLQSAQLTFEINNPFQYRIPNRLIVGMVSASAFNGSVTKDPFCFQKFGLSSIRQLLRGEEYPYETLEMDHNNGTKDLRGYFRYLQATGSLCRQKGNMVRASEWGQGKNCTLFVFDNAANGCLDSPVFNPKQSGELRLTLNFGAPTPENITVIVYGEFENLLEIDGNKAVMYDIYQR